MGDGRVPVVAAGRQLPVLSTDIDEIATATRALLERFEFDPGVFSVSSRARDAITSSGARGSLMFLTRLAVSHIDGKRWELTDPLVWEGQDDLFVIRERFRTDFASIPKPLRWLLDNAGANSEAAVLHDAAWRESRQAYPRIDPADADGLFRRSLRETGSTALTRGLMWFGVRATAIVGGRYGNQGPGRTVKIAQLAGMLVVGVFTALLPTIAALAGLIVFWLANWVVAVAWRPFERRRFPGFAGNWPWNPLRRAPKLKELDQDLLVILPRASDVAGAVVAAITNHRIDSATLNSIVGPP